MESGNMVWVRTSYDLTVSTDSPSVVARVVRDPNGKPCADHSLSSRRMRPDWVR